jgi:hypothetical protein
MTAPSDPSTGDEQPPEEKYDEVDPEDVTDDAIEFLRKGVDDPKPVTPPVRDPDEPPPPNA